MSCERRGWPPHVRARSGVAPVPKRHSGLLLAAANPCVARQRTSNNDRQVFSLHQGLQPRGLDAVSAILEAAGILEGDGISDCSPKGTRLLGDSADIQQLVAAARAHAGCAVAGNLAFLLIDTWAGRLVGPQCVRREVR